MSDTQLMTDLEFVDHWIENCLVHINPFLFSKLKQRRLYDIVNYLPKNANEAKAIARARMSKAGKYFGDDEIDKIAGEIAELEKCRTQLNNLNLTDAHLAIPILEKMKAHAIYVKDYFKPVKLPE